MSLNYKPPQKTCTNCGAIYPATPEHFHKRRKSKDGLMACCKTCSLARSKDRRIKHPNYSSEWYRKHPEYHKKWRAKNPDKERAHNAKRRARISEAEGSYTASDIERQIKIQNRRCWWCGKKLKNTYHVDHRIPLSRGGSNSPSNLVISCPHCNMSKNDKLPCEFSDRLL